MPPATILIKPASSSCNMRCRYCFYADVAEHRQVKNYGIMSPETHEIMVKYALRYAEGYCLFAFQGGEPTLAGLDYFKRHVKLCNNYNVNNVHIAFSLQTNGYIINDEWADFLAKNRFLVGLSLDGPQKIHDSYRFDAKGKGTFQDVMRAAKLFDKYHVEYNILCVVNNLVAKNAAKVYDFFKNSGFRYLQFIPCLAPFDFDDKEDSLTAENYGDFLCATFDRYYKDFKSNNYISIRYFDNLVMMLKGRRPENCGMSGICTSYFVVESDGSVYPCDFYVLDKYRIGNLSLQDFSQISASPVVRQFVDESRPIDRECRICKWFKICRGGCRRYREPFVDGKPGLNKFCTAFKKFFDYSYIRLRELAFLTI